MPSGFRVALAAGLGLGLTFGLIACTDNDQPSPADASPSSANETPDLSDDSTPSVEPAGSSDLPQGDDPVDLDPADFTTKIDNPYFPLVPGTRTTYREIDEEGNNLKVVVPLRSRFLEDLNRFLVPLELEKCFREVKSEETGSRVCFDRPAQYANRFLIPASIDQRIAPIVEQPSVVRRTLCQFLVDRNGRLRLPSRAKGRR